MDTLATDCDTVSCNFFPQRDWRWSIREATTGTDLRWIHLGLDSISWMAAFLELRRNASEILGELEHLAKYFEFSHYECLAVLSFVEKLSTRENLKIDRLWLFKRPGVAIVFDLISSQCSWSSRLLRPDRSFQGFEPMCDTDSNVVAYLQGQSDISSKTEGRELQTTSPRIKICTSSSRNTSFNCDWNTTMITRSKYVQKCSRRTSLILYRLQIQKRWRGFYVRKYVLDYYSRKKYFAGLEQKNEQIRCDFSSRSLDHGRSCRCWSRLQLQEYREYLEQKQIEQQRQANISKLEEEAKRTHHLVSTKAVPGIYNSKYLEWDTSPETYYIRRELFELVLPRKWKSFWKIPNSKYRK